MTVVCFLQFLVHVLDVQIVLCNYVSVLEILSFKINYVLIGVLTLCVLCYDLLR